MNFLVDKEKLIRSLLPDAYLSKEELIEELELAESWSINPPPFCMKNFECAVEFSFTDREMICDAEVFLSELLSLKKYPENIISDIESLCYKKKVKEKLTCLIKSGREGMRTAASELLQFNMKNFQSNTKEVIEKIILLLNLVNSEINRFHPDSRDFLNTIIDLQHIISSGFNDFYNKLINENHLHSLVSNLENGINDERAEILYNALDAERWDYNEELIRKSIISGPEYINRKSRKYAFVDLSLNVMVEFGEYYTPRKTSSIKYLNSIISNYFTASSWRRHASRILKYYILHHRMNRIMFEFCKDSTLSLRFIAGGDCTSGMNLQLADSASAFYKICMNDEWIGYVSLLSVKTGNGNKAILIDVMNIKESFGEYHFAISDLFDSFIDGLIDQTGITGYRYLLIPAQSELLSNRNTYSIYQKYKRYPGIKGPLLLYRGEDREYTDDFLNVFQSLKSEYYIIVRDLENDRQGILPGLNLNMIS